MMQATAKRIDVTLNAGQYDLMAAALDDDASVVAGIAGSGGGKTWLGARIMLAWLTKQQGNYIAVSPTFGMLDRTLVPTLTGMLDDYGVRYEHLQQRGIIKALGSTIYLASADNPERIEGIHAIAAWLDEAGQMERLMFEVASRRVGLVKGKVLITTTPYSMNWLKNDVYDRWLAGDKNYYVRQWSSIDNPAYSREFFERARSEMSDARFKMMMLGEFAASDGLIWPDALNADLWEDAPEVQASWSLYHGLDFGYNHPTAGVWAALDNDDVLHVNLEYVQAGRTIDEHAVNIKLIEAGRSFIRWGDPENKQAMADLAARDLYYQNAIKPVLEGIDKVTARIRTGRIRFTKGLTNLARTFSSYEWERVNDMPTDRPRKRGDGTDDIADALRYMVMGIDSGPKPMIWILE